MQGLKDSYVSLSLLMGLNAKHFLVIVLCLNENNKVWLNSDVFPSQTRLTGWQSSVPSILLPPPTLPHAWDDIIFHM